MPPRLETNKENQFYIKIQGNILKGIPDFNADFEEFDRYLRDHCTLDNFIVNDFGELCLSFDFDRFIFYKLTGFLDWVIDNCPNKRVVHLIKHGKNKRVKSKNFNRAIKIIVKELTNG